MRRALIQIALSALSLAVLVDAGRPPLTFTLASSTRTKTVCRTSLATTPHNGPIPTSSSTKRLPPDYVIIFSPSVPVKTITPPPVTTTTTLTAQSTVVTTDHAVTDVFTTTTTSTTTSVSTTTYTSTGTSTASTTVTSTTTTSIAPAVTGFQPVVDTSSQTNYTDTRLKRENSMDLGAADFDLARRWGTPPPPQGGWLCPPQPHPASVKCTKQTRVIYTEKVVVVEPAHTKTLRPATSTARVTTTVLSTSTVVPPDVSTTITVVQTSTTTSTSTATTSTATTTTLTATASITATAYPSCQSNNILGPRIQPGFQEPGDTIINAYDPSRTLLATQGQATDPYGCCVECASTVASPPATPGCIASYFQLVSNTCFIIVRPDGTCPAQFQANALELVIDTTPGGDGGIVSNGCAGYQGFIQ